MKKAIKGILIAITSLTLAFSLYSCNGGENPGEQEGDPCAHTNVRIETENVSSATCTVAGEYEEVKICVDCTAVIARDKVTVEPLGHDEIQHSGKSATCSEAGYAAYVECSRCEYTTYQEIDILEHNIEQYPEKAATCTEAGYYAFEKCSNCEYTTYSVIPALEHDIVEVFGSEPRCTQPGYYDYEYCTKCEYTTYEEIPPLDHKKVPRAAQDPACEEFGWYAYEDCERCDWSSKYENLIDPIGHDEIFHEEKLPTCTEGGHESYYTCSRCEYVTPYDTYGPRHTLEDVEMAKQATCTEPGWEWPYQRCTLCDYKDSRYVEIPAHGHKYDTYPAKARTCTEGGWTEFRYCIYGDWSEEQESKLPPLGHAIVNHEAKEPTCEKFGWYAYETCSRCTEHNTYREIDALGHIPNDQSKAPTCEEDGYTLITCHRCEDFRIYEYREAHGHDIVPELIIEPTCTTVGYKTIEYCRTCYVIEHTPQIAPHPELLKTVAHNFVDGVCTACGNREGSAGLEFKLGSDGRSYEVVGLGTCTDKIIVIPSTHEGLPVVGIESVAFAYSDIVSIYIPNTMKKANGIAISSGAFMECFHLVEVINNSDIDFEYFGYFIKEYNLAVHNGSSKLVLVGDYYFFVEDGEAILVSYIGEDKEITLPENYNGESYKIHNSAFRGSGIESIVVPTAVTEIGDWALYTKNSVKCVTINYLGTQDEWKNVILAADCKQWTKELVYHYGREHDLTHFDGKAPTCSEWGYTAYDSCSMCDFGKTEYEKLEPTGHFYEYVECRFCGEEIEYQRDLNIRFLKTACIT